MSGHLDVGRLQEAATSDVMHKTPGRLMLISAPSNMTSATSTMAVTEGLAAAARRSASELTYAAAPDEPQRDGRGAAGGGGAEGGSGGGSGG